MGIRLTNDRIRNETWRNCDLCGFEYPVSQMWYRRGHFVCREQCADADMLKEAQTPDLGDNKQVTPS